MDEVAIEYEKAKADPGFVAELEATARPLRGPPERAHRGPRFARHAGGARVFLKREDLNHTGSHKINNVLGQALLTTRMGKPRVIAETGAGQHGVATATACALFGLECTVYMGEIDIRRQAVNVARMKMLGATVIPVTSGSRTLKDAINETFRDWVANVETTHYIFGTVAGPHPFPAMIRDFQRVIGVEARRQILERAGRLPDAAIACVGGGSNAIGLFHAFLPDAEVRLIGCEAAGHGVETGRHAATLSAGEPGILHGSRSYVLQDDEGQITEPWSISAGLDYPGVGPEHAYLHDTGRGEYRPVTDAAAMRAFRLLASTEGIIPAIESAHALAGAIEVGTELGPDGLILVNLSGRGDKDMDTAARYFEQRRRRGDGRGSLASERKPSSCWPAPWPGRSRRTGPRSSPGCRPASRPSTAGIAAIQAIAEQRRRHRRGRLAAQRPGTRRPGHPGRRRHRPARRRPDRRRHPHGARGIPGHRQAGPGHVVLEPDRPVRRRALQPASWPRPAARAASCLTCPCRSPRGGAEARPATASPPSSWPRRAPPTSDCGRSPRPGRDSSTPHR